MKNERKKMIFSYWKNGEMICKGSAKEIAEQLGKTKSTVYGWFENRRPCLKLEGTMEHVYEVYTTDGTVLFRGTSRECAKKMFITEGAFKSALHGTRHGKRT